MGRDDMSDDDEGGRGRKDAVKSLAAGGVAGATAKTAVGPLDRTKILMQVAGALGWHRCRSIGDTMRFIWHSDGLMGFWRGNTALILRIAPYAAVQFASFEKYNRWLASREMDSILQRFLAGSLAGATAVTVTYPLDMIRTQLAIQHAGSESAYKGPGQALWAIARTEGWKGLYRGVKPTLMGICLYGGFSFSTFGVLKARATRTDFGRQYKVLVSLSCGAVAGLVGQTASYPFDVVRRRWQVQGLTPGALLPISSSYSPHSGVFSSIAAIARREGVLGLYRGLSLNFIKAAPAVAISFTVYDYLRDAWGVKSSKFSATLS
mmetsp:Transcript_6260/g.12408  ORF Transcript_6260/g.12408 Transcript_6260/m.12408 type:complete len:321 (-) Transcript_6260:3401-4363(-)